MASGVQVHFHAPLPHGAIGLRPPGTSRLAIATWGDAEDAFDILKAGLLPPVELGHPFVPIEPVKILGRAWLDAVKVGMVTDFMILESLDDVVAFSAFQSAGLFTDDLKRGSDAFLAEKVGDPKPGIVAGRQDVVFSVGPQDNVDLGRAFRPRGAACSKEEQGEKQQWETNLGPETTGHL